LSRRSFRVYFVKDKGGLFTGRLIPNAHTRRRLLAAGASEEQVYAELELAIELLAGQGNEEDLDAFLWSEDLTTSTVRVEVRPQTVVEKRTVIAKDGIPLELTYAWAALEGGAGFRVLLPRFDWSLVVEELGMASEVLRQAIGSALIGEVPHSLLEFREAAAEYVAEWLPKAHRLKGRKPEAQETSFPTVQQVAEDWSALGRAGKLKVHYGPVDAAAYTELLSSKRKPSLLLVGPSGSGKTEWVRELARRAARSAGEGGDDVRVWATSADRIMAGMQYLGMWEQRCLDLVAELSSEGHYLYVDRLTTLTQARTGGSSIADLFLPALQDGEVSLIAECTAPELERLSAETPTLIACFRVQQVESLPAAQVPVLINEYLERQGNRFHFHPDALRRLVRHLSLFRKDHAFPGKVFTFLHWLEQNRAPAGPGQPPETIAPRAADRLFARYSGLPEQLISDDELADAEALAALLSRGVVGQESACRTCAELLARFKAGVIDPDKPAGSLLFVGPTGVGKTELAKQLSRVMFGSEDRLIRFDMSEYMLSGSTHRLLADDKGSASLAQQVSRQPLCVVLLDEIEKAHPAVFDLLLGVLGEGRLTAASGRLVDFRMAIIVMTSNLGSGVTRVGFGQPGATLADGSSAVREHFRPEFFNRLDYVVPFGTLSPEALRRIVELLLAKLEQRQGLLRRRLRLEVSDAAKVRLAELGWHPQYGARPLTRVIEEQIMTPIAVELSRRPKLTDQRVVVSAEGSAIKIAFNA
jgi:ATP-dependent Clp protease ATP-binding subunit ClpC